jgi:hypothetical protein
MLNGGKAVRDRDGKIIESAAFQKTERETEVGRVQADRRWFGEWGGCSRVYYCDAHHVPPLP